MNGILTLILIVVGVLLLWGIYAFVDTCIRESCARARIRSAERYQYKKTSEALRQDAEQAAKAMLHEAQQAKERERQIGNDRTYY